MATIHPIALTYSELFNEPANDPFGQDMGKQATCIAAVYLNWRTNTDVHDPDEVQDDLLLDFNRLVGGVIAFVEDGRSPARVLRVLHGFQRFVGIPDRPNKERKQVFCYQGGVSVDLTTVPFDEDQLDYVLAVNFPCTIERVIQLLEEEPTHKTIGPLCVGDANAHRRHHTNLHVPTI
jgi:hypothetical protein